MDWATIHAYAIEAELWTSLAINCWLIGAATIFIAGRALRPTSSAVSQATRASMWAIIVVNIITLVGGLMWLLFNYLGNPDLALVPMLQTPQGRNMLLLMILSIFIASLPIILATIMAASILRRRD